MAKINKLICKKETETLLNYKKYYNLALDVFRWEGLPEGLESRFIEDQLFNYGQCFFYKHPLRGIICLPCFDTNTMNIYGEFDTGNVMSANGLVNDLVEYKDGVRIFNNDLKEPTRPYIIEYATQMTDVQSSIKMNVHQQKFPYFIKCNRKNQLTWETMYKKIEMGDPAIFMSDMLDLESISVSPTLSPYVVDKLQTYYYQLEGQILTFLGIDNSLEKDSGVSNEETISNNEFIQRNIEIQYKNRLDACKIINEMFPELNVSVLKVSDIVRDDNVNVEVDENEEEGIIDNEGMKEDAENTSDDKSFIDYLKTLFKFKGGE